MSFLHGFEFILTQGGLKPIRTPRSGVIALVGTAPSGPVEALTLVTNENAAAAFGQQVRGYSIPQALAAIFAHGGAAVLVVNVFNKSTMSETIAAESQTIANRRVKVSETGFYEMVSVKTSGGSPVTLTAGTDYTVDDFGTVTVLNATYANGSTLVLEYKRMDDAAITSSVINGTINGTTQVRTGMQLFATAYSAFGFKPKLFIAPYFSQLAAVQAELLSQATTLKGLALLDTAESLTPQNVVTERGPGGDYAVSSRYAAVCYPWLRYASPDTNTSLSLPFSAAYAGAIAANDDTQGYWVSPSNIQLLGITGVERSLVGNGLSDTNAEWNLLNDAGVVTIYQGFGTGTRVWGNRTSAHPAATAPEDVFISVGRVQWMLHDALEQSLLPFIDQPINQPLIDSIRDSVNAYMRTLIQQGALVDGECQYLAADNPESELAAGHLTFRLVFMPPTPAERITFLSRIDTSLLKFS